MRLEIHQLLRELAAIRKLLTALLVRQMNAGRSLETHWYEKAMDASLTAERKENEDTP